MSFIPPKSARPADTVQLWLNLLRHRRMWAGRYPIVMAIVIASLALGFQVSNAAGEPKFKGAPPSVYDANGAYVLSESDLALDCRTLTGRMQVRIRQLRGSMADAKTSELARGLQQLTKPLSGSSRSGDPNVEAARDLAMLQAYNGRLITKNCPAFNLASDLAPGNTAAPKPVKAAKAKPEPQKSPAKPLFPDATPAATLEAQPPSR